MSAAPHSATGTPGDGAENAGQTKAGRVIAILGAESTGKTALAQALVPRLAQWTGLPCTWVPEWLRLWCEQAGRTPSPHEQEDIALEQTRRIEHARQSHAWVVADTTALMTSVYSQWIFQDDTLEPAALQAQRGYTLTLVTANDLPWQADGWQRDGPQVRDPVHRRITAALHRGQVVHHLVQGHGEARLESALQALRPLMAPVY